MKAAVIGACAGAIVAAIITGALPVGSDAHAQRMASPTGLGELITSTVMTADNRQMVTIIEPHTRVMAVYLVDGATGQTALKSVRNLQWDLQLSDFNGVNPLPREIQSLLEQNIR